MIAEDFRILRRRRAFCSIRFLHLGLVGLLTFERPALMRLIEVQIPDVPPFSMQPRFRWSHIERTHFSLSNATAFFISRQVVQRVRIRDCWEGLEVCAANAVFRHFMRGSKILDASWNHPGSFLPTFPKIKGAVVLIASDILV